MNKWKWNKNIFFIGEKLNEREWYLQFLVLWVGALYSRFGYRSGGSTRLLTTDDP